MAYAAPAPPANLTLSATALSGQVSLTWNPPSGATSYNLKRSTTADGVFSTVSSPTTNNFTDATAVVGTRYFYQVTALNATGESTPSLTISTTPSIVMDNAAASGVTITGTWAASTGLAGFYGSNYLHDNNSGGSGGKSVRFTPDLPFGGRYDVYLRWVADNIRASNARVEINSAAGTTYMRVNQTSNGGAWVKLGAFNFNAGTGGSVRIRNDGADGYVIADAVQLVLNDQPLPGYTQTTFADEFDGTAYDPAVWAVHDNRPNNSVSGGQLRLTTTANGNDWNTGSLYTSQFNQRFGYFETVYQIGRSNGLNNAFWLNTPANHFNNADRLEVDISESHAHDDNHVGVHDWRPVHDHVGATFSVPDIYPGYHVVGLEWATDGTMRWYWDGKLRYTLPASQLNAYESMLPLQVMLSTKVIDFAGTPGPNLDGSSMNIDNVRVWMKPGWGGAESGNWGTSANWGPDGVPGAGDAAVFNRDTTRTTVSLAGDKSVKELYFTTPECPPMTLAAGSFKLLLGALASGAGVGGIVVNADVITPQSIHTAIEARNDLTFANYSITPGAALDIDSTLTSSATGRSLTFGGNGRVNMDSSIGSSFGSLVKVNSGTTVLSGANAFTGVMDVQDGEVIVTHASALGATTSGTNVESGASLALANGVNINNPETVSLAGDGEAGTAGALDVADDSNVTFNGQLTMTAAARIGSGLGAGTLTLGSSLDTTASSFALTFDGNGTTIMNGNISGAGTLTKTGSGTLHLNGIATQTGVTTVQQGTLSTNLLSLPGAVVNSGTVICNDAANRTATNNWGGSGTYIKEGAGTITIAGTMNAVGFLELRAGSVKLGANERLANTLDLIVNPGAVFDLNAFSEFIGPVELRGGSIVNSTGTPSQYLAGSSFLLESGNVSARLGGSGALTKTTSGTVTLSGANTFTGGSTVQEGILDLAGSLNSSLTLNGGQLTLGATTGSRSVGGNLTVNALGNIRFRINGPNAGTQYDQLILGSATSDMTLAGTLDLIAMPGLAAGDSYLIIDNSGSSNAVVGTFAGLPEGAEFYEDEQWWRISYTGGTGNDVVLSRITPTAWQAWQSANFGTNANNPLIAGDFADQDLVSNLMEYATGMNPSINDTVPQSLAKNGGVIEFIHTRNKAATDVTYSVEWSDDFTNWSVVDVTNTVLSDNGTTQQIKSTIPAEGTVVRRFVRLKVTRS